MASILETFYVLFDSDASKLKKGAEEADKSTKKLEESIKSVDSIGKKAGESFSDLAKHAAAALATVFAVHHVLEKVTEIAEINDHLGKLSTAIGVNIQDLGAWGDAAKEAGGSSEAFQQSIKGMAASFAMFATTGHSRQAKFFQELGISMVDAHHKARDVMTVLPELAEKFEKMGKQQSFGIGERMGLDEGTIMLLQRGRREVEEMVKRKKELGETDTIDAEKATKFNEALDDTHHVFRSLYTTIGSTVLPVLTWLLNKFVDIFVFLRKNHEIALALVGAVLAFISPVLAIGAAIALVFEDLYRWVTGGKSLIGEFVGSFDDLIKKPGELWDAFAQKFPAIADLIKKIGELIAKGLKIHWELFVDTLKAGGHVIFGILSGFKLMLEGIWFVIKKVVEGWGMIASGVGGLLEGGLESLGFGQKAVASAGGSPINSMSSSAISNSSKSSKQNTVNIGEVKVQTQATDAEGISKSIGTTLNDHMRNAQDQADDGEW